MMPQLEELRRIQAELKKPFPAPLHEIRELPGGAKKWVFLRWQTVRERLDEVVPDWTIDHSEIQYLNNDAICRCGITILGVRKEAIASVPITLMSKAGNDMARGSAADRLAAEALKNAAETWGIGRYLDDQPFTIRYLWENRYSLDDRMLGEIRKLSEQYKLQFKSSVTPTPTKKSDSSFSDALSAPAATTVQATAINRDLLISETDSLMRRKGISTEAAKQMARQWFGTTSRQNLTDVQLVELRDRLSLIPSQNEKTITA